MPDLTQLEHSALSTPPERHKVGTNRAAFQQFYFTHTDNKRNIFKKGIPLSFRPGNSVKFI